MSKSVFKIVVIDKGGKLKQTSIETDDYNPLSIINKRLLYTACKYKLTTKPCKNELDGFDLLHKFNKDSFPNFTRSKCGMKSSSNHEDAILVFGKSNGKAGKENKYEFPPPIDNNIFYGTLCLVKCSICLNGNNDKADNDSLLSDMEKHEWEKLYELLFGGFDECEHSEEEEPDVLEQISDKKKTKDGYLKDGFVVDDTEYVSDEEDEYAETDLSDEEDFQFSDED